MPAAVVQGQDEENEYAGVGPIGKARGQVQVDAWAEDRPACEALRVAARDALGGFHDATITTVGATSGPPILRPGREALARRHVLRRVGRCLAPARTSGELERRG